MNTEKNKLIELLKADIINNLIESNAPIYQPIYFDEFKDIKTSLNRDNFYKKFDLIFRYININLSNRRVLDIGSNAGFFSFAAAERNATVDALEPLTRYYKLCQNLCEIYNIPNINFINAPISVEFLENKKYDYGFMLSVFQWISEGNNKLGYAKDILMETSEHVDTLFFELGCNYGKSAVKTRKINHLAYIYSLLKNNTIYKNIKLIGVTKIWGRPSYRRLLVTTLSNLYNHSRGLPYRYLFVCSNKHINIRESFYFFLKWINI